MQAWACHTAYHHNEHCSLCNPSLDIVPVVAHVSPKIWKHKPSCSGTHLNFFFAGKWGSFIPYSCIYSLALNGESIFHLLSRFFLKCGHLQHHSDSKAIPWCPNISLCAVLCVAFGTIMKRLYGRQACLAIIS